MENKQRLTRILLNILVPASGIFLVFWLGPKLLRFFLPFVIGGLIAAIANPLVRFLEKRIKIRRKHSSAVLIVGTLALVILGGYALVSALGRELMAFVGELPELWASLEGDFVRIEINIESLLTRLPGDVQSSLMGATSNLSESIGALAAKLGEPTLGVVGRVTKSLPSLLVNTVVTLVSAYFFLADREQVGQLFRKWIPKAWMTAFEVVKSNTKRIIFGYFAAQFKIMLVVLVVLYVGFKILGVKYSFLIALGTALLDVLPVFGTGFVLWPWMVFEVLSGDLGMTVGLALIYVASQGFHQAVQPKLVGDSMGMNPLYTLVLLFLGFKFYGLGGMIIAVPIGMIVEDLYRGGMFDGLIENGKLLGQEIQRLRGLEPDEGDNE